MKLERVRRIPKLPKLPKLPNQKKLRVVRYHSQILFKPSQVKKSYGLGNFGLREGRQSGVYLK